MENGFVASKLYILMIPRPWHTNRELKNMDFLYRPKSIMKVKHGTTDMKLKP